MADTAARKALNQGTFRDANEKLERGARQILGGDDQAPVPFLCECSRIECTEIVLATLTEYEAVRARPRGGILVAGHPEPSIERVVDENERFVVTEKFGEAGEIHAAQDPRREDEQARRIGENQALYRQVNERIEELNESLGSFSGVFEIMCECGDLGCTEMVSVPHDLYEHVRKSSARFITKPGHEIVDVEHVVERHEAFVVVEKDPGPARRVAEETDNTG